MGKNRGTADQMIFNESLKIFLVTTIYVIILVVEICFMTSQCFACDNIEMHAESLNTDISGIEYLSSRNGIKQWTVQSKYVGINKTGEKVFVFNPKIEFYLKNNDKFYLSAMFGLIDNISNSVSTFGNVCINGWNITVETNHAKYYFDSFSLTSNKSTVFFGKSFSVNSDSLSVNLDSRLFQFSGNVKSKLSNAF